MVNETCLWLLMRSSNPAQTLSIAHLVIPQVDAISCCALIVFTGDIDGARLVRQGIAQRNRHTISRQGSTHPLPQPSHMPPPVSSEKHNHNVSVWLERSEGTERIGEQLCEQLAEEGWLVEWGAEAEERVVYDDRRAILRGFWWIWDQKKARLGDLMVTSYT